MHLCARIRIALLSLALYTTSGTLALAQGKEAPPPFKPAIIYSLTGNTTKAGANKSDGAFIESARIGIEKVKRDFGITVTEHRMRGNENLTAAIKRIAESGANPIIALGSQNVVPVLELAGRYPDTQFTVIDGLVPPILPNVQSILFKDNEGAFLVGLIAGKTATDDHVGFIGGLDSPLIRNFAAGYAQGVRYANPSAHISTAMIGGTVDAWNNPKKAYKLAMQQYKEGADVIFAAAGGSSLGVLKAANDTHKFAIGIDSNQNGIYPGRVLTSLVKRVDVAIYDSLKRSHDHTWNPGIKYLGIKEGALDYAVDENNRSLISESLIDEVSTAKERIINGLIIVDAYSPK